MTSDDNSEKINLARQMVKEARHLVVFTGAGISTPSGIPDFRSKGSGLWEKSDPMEVASLSTFRSDPKRFWDWKRPLLRQIWQAKPNAAHFALAELEKTGRLKAIVTQNIDGLHQKAGTKTVLELHGSVETMSCQGCGRQFPSAQFQTMIEQTEEMPRCARCGEVMKPDIVLFEEMLPQTVWNAAEKHCARADVLIVIGSSLEVWPAAALPEKALLNGAHLIIVNLTPTHLDPRAKIILPKDAAVMLPLISGCEKLAQH
jgi:NAD-dependent deacetylase